MSIEEKAKAYDEALERARRIKNGEGDWRYSDLIEISPALTEIFPELCESEDERIRKGLVKLLTVAGEAYLVESTGIKKDSYLAYLEKQKENPKNAISIPADCATNAKYEDRWHKVGNSLPDNPREVLCKDEAGNYFIGRYYVGEGWEISNYDDEDKPHHLNPPVSKWIDFPSEKQKEQKSSINIEQLKSLMLQYLQEASNEKDDSDIEADTDKWASKILGYDFEQKEQKPEESIPHLTVQGKCVYKICPRCKERMVRDDSKVYNSMPPQYGYKCPKCGEMEFDTVIYDSPKIEEQKPELVQQPPITYTYPSDASRDERLKAALLALLNSDLLKVKEGGYFTKQDLIEWVERIPTDKPAEWSEEDADILNCCISSIEEAKENRYAYKETDGDTSYDREIDWLKSILPSWKPSEEQMDALNALNCHGDLSYVGQQNQLISLYNDLKKLM